MKESRATFTQGLFSQKAKTVSPVRKNAVTLRTQWAGRISNWAEETSLDLKIRTDFLVRKVEANRKETRLLKSLDSTGVGQFCAPLKGSTAVFVCLMWLKTSYILLVVHNVGFLLICKYFQTHFGRLLKPMPIFAHIFTTNCREHQVCLVVELTYSACCYHGGPLVDADIKYCAFQNKIQRFSKYTAQYLYAQLKAPCDISF